MAFHGTNGCGSEEVTITEKSEPVLPRVLSARKAVTTPLTSKPDAEVAMADDSYRQEPNYQLVFTY